MPNDEPGTPPLSAWSPADGAASPTGEGAARDDTGGAVGSVAGPRALPGAESEANPFPSVESGPLAGSDSPAGAESSVEPIAAAAPPSPVAAVGTKAPPPVMSRGAASGMRVPPASG